MHCSEANIEKLLILFYVQITHIRNDICNAASQQKYLKNISQIEFWSDRVYAHLKFIIAVIYTKE